MYTLLVVAIVSCFGLIVRADEITEAPTNVATKVHQSISLHCTGNGILEWDEFITSSKAAQPITYGKTVLDTVKDKYSLNTDSGKFELVIKSPVLSDGGKYQCKAVTDATNQYGDAEVIVFESDPTCTTNVTLTDNKAVEGDYVAYSCEVKYQGRWAPVMEWKNNDKILQAKDESNGNIAKYTYVTELTPADNGAKFTCRTYFNQPDSLEVKEASNIPATDNVLTKYESPQLTVYYGPHTLVVDPVRESYYPDDIVKISAESNPSSKTYKWVNTGTNETIGTSNMITITASMLGSQSIEVTVCNTIPIPPAKTICKEHHLNLTVMTTTTSTTTTTTTTTPATTTKGAVPPSGGSTTTPAAGGTSDGTKKAGLGIGPIIGIVAGVVVFLIIILLIYIFVIRNRKRKGQDEPYTVHMDSTRRKPVPVDQVRSPDVLSPHYGRHDGLNDNVPPPTRGPEDVMYADLEMMRDNQADLAIDDVPRSRKPLQVFEPGSGVEYASIQPNRKKDRMQ